MFADNPSDFHVEVDTVNKVQWSDLLMQFDDTTIYQSWSYASVLYGKNNLSHLVLKNNDNIIAIAQIGIRYFPLLGTATANVHWGPLWRKKNTALSIDNFEGIIKALINEYGIKRRLLLRIWPFDIDCSENKAKIILQDAGFIPNSLTPAYRTLRLSLKPSLEDLRKNLDQKWRNQLNRAEKTNFDIIEGNDDNLYKVFLALQGEMFERKKYVSGVDYKQYRLIQNDLPLLQKMKIVVCEYENEPIAVSICSAIGDTGIYLLGATGNKGMRLNGSNLLQWRMIKWLKERGCLYYDLGGIDPEANPGVYRFKCGIAGKIGRDEKHIGQYVFHNNIKAHLLNIAINTTRNIQKRLQTIRKRSN
jgi:hypothetical protein